MTDIDETRLIVAIANCAVPVPEDRTEPGAAFDRGFNSGLRVAIQAVRGECEVAAYAKALGVERKPLERAASSADFADTAYDGWSESERAWGR